MNGCREDAAGAVEDESNRASMTSSPSVSDYCRNDSVLSVTLRSPRGSESVNGESRGCAGVKPEPRCSENAARTRRPSRTSARGGAGRRSMADTYDARSYDVPQEKPAMRAPP